MQCCSARPQLGRRLSNAVLLWWWWGSGANQRADQRAHGAVPAAAGATWAGCLCRVALHARTTEGEGVCVCCLFNKLWDVCGGRDLCVATRGVCVCVMMLRARANTTQTPTHKRTHRERRRGGAYTRLSILNVKVGDVGVDRNAERLRERAARRIYDGLVDHAGNRSDVDLVVLGLVLRPQHLGRRDLALEGDQADRADCEAGVVRDARGRREGAAGRRIRVLAVVCFVCVFVCGCVMWFFKGARGA